MDKDINMRKTTFIAIVDDEDSFRKALETLLRSSGYSIRAYCNAREFLSSTNSGEIHCLISDIQMPEMSGVEMCEQLIAMGIRIPTIFITGYPAAAPHITAATPNLIACLPKPCDADRLLNCVETALRQQP
ncbi:chemotaxis protein CheY [Pseudomonas fluorescens]|uniref:response regulator transcription factor n=1 Tax=Pseudomonas fluorescens TaxID=294 RepID=UPI00054C180B|nr:response regulator [Pseudomonas fluorescens]KII27588.1 chemotaxis protein CheY [Pseudomonas fluorescens]